MKGNILLIALFLLLSTQFVRAELIDLKLTEANVPDMNIEKTFVSKADMIVKDKTIYIKPIVESYFVTIRQAEELFKKIGTNYEECRDAIGYMFGDNDIFSTLKFRTDNNELNKAKHGIYNFDDDTFVSLSYLQLCGVKVCFDSAEECEKIKYGLAIDEYRAKQQVFENLTK